MFPYSLDSADASLKLAWARDAKMFFFPHKWGSLESLLRSTLAISMPAEFRIYKSVRSRNLRLLVHRKQPNLGISEIEEAQAAALAGLKVCLSTMRFLPGSAILTLCIRST